MPLSVLQRDEARLIEAAFFNELAEDSKVVPTRPGGVSLPAKGDLEEQKSKPNEFSTFANPPRCSKELKLSKKTDSAESITFVRKLSL